MSMNCTPPSHSGTKPWPRNMASRLRICGKCRGTQVYEQTRFIHGTSCTMALCSPVSSSTIAGGSGDPYVTDGPTSLLTGTKGMQQVSGRLRKRKPSWLFVLLQGK